ncbi:cysteine desulfurase, putative [Plasmodium yoelii]|uniref:Cysteine desulfurase, putative n=1 Tax=Plasmodium yoelii TaxID=5861 RepID=A0A078KDR4_PLAYE|nr:cysteine desulfurase, putative [Plasmodium yoelii]CDU17021.1 cysteine desulfurase, putative [Plasmodium yoelii]VTZ75416.1 cysteine desulfurase, putative [Plasmodium yoelii]|eukprot:XP_022813179.1 cysteine desulfurase, putative [Plasmodium yoelii]
MNNKSICILLLLFLKITGYYSYYISPLKKNIYTHPIYKRHILKLQNEKPEIDSNIINYFKNIRSDFPFFQQNNSPIYFDNAATTHKPASVIEKIKNFYSYNNSNIHRGIYKISRNATDNYENVRIIVQKYINCDSSDEIIFTSGATYGINLVCNIIMDKIIKNENDEIYISYLEHNSNIIPWQENIRNKKKGKLKYIPLKKNGYINIKKFVEKINNNTKIVSINHVSNVLGNIQNINLIIKKIKKKNPNIIVIIDAAQSFPHLKYDIKKMKLKNEDPDILITSGHKFCAPFGSGFVYIKKKITHASKTNPFLYGSNIITDVNKYRSKFVSSPHIFETGTQNISAILAMGEAIKYLQKINDEGNAYKYEMYLYDLFLFYLRSFLTHHLVELPNIPTKLDEMHTSIQIRNNKVDDTYTHSEIQNEDNDYLKIFVHNTRKDNKKKIGILPLWSLNFTSFDLVTFLDFKNICIRSGHHCASLLHNKFFNINESSRVSIMFYNTPEEVQYLAEQISATTCMLHKMRTNGKAV